MIFFLNMPMNVQKLYFSHDSFPCNIHMLSTCFSPYMANFIRNKYNVQVSQRALFVRMSVNTELGSIHSRGDSGSRWDSGWILKVELDISVRMTALGEIFMNLRGDVRDFELRPRRSQAAVHSLGKVPPVSWSRGLQRRPGTGSLTELPEGLILPYFRIFQAVEEPLTVLRLCDPSEIFRKRM